MISNKRYNPYIAKPSKNNRGYLLTISDLMGFAKLSIQVGLDPVFEYAGYARAVKGQRPLKFKTNLSDGKWHQFAYSITGSLVSLYVDCRLVDSMPIKVNQQEAIPIDTVTSIGKTFFESRKYPRYEVSQICII